MIFQNAFDPFRSLKATFAAMNLAPAQLWGGGLLIAFLDACASNGGGDTSNNEIPPEMALIFLCVGCGIALVAFIASCWVRPGVFLNLKSVLETGEPDSKGIFDHRGLFVQVLLASLLKAVILLAGALIAFFPLIIAFIGMFTGGIDDVGGPLMIGGFALTALVGFPALIYLNCGLALMGEIVIYERAKPTEALSRSWEIARGNRWQMIVYGLVTGIFALLGLLLCCIGVIPTSAITTLAWGEAYLQLRDTGEVAREGGLTQSGPPEGGSDYLAEDRSRLD